MYMEKLRFFDCNSYFGMRKLMLPGSFHTKEELLSRMERYGIDKALVHHAFARELDPAIGNARLMEEISGEDKLVPAWMIMPHHTGEFPDPDTLADMMKKDGVRAAVMLPSLGYYYFSTKDWNCGALFTMLEEARIPLFMAMHNFDPNFENLHDILRAHPRLRLVLTNVTYRVARNIYPLMNLFDNLHIETFGFKTQDGIADLCHRFGAERVLFGSGMPEASGAGAVAMVTYADLTFEEKQLVAAGNLERLLGGVKL